MASGLLTVEEVDGRKDLSRFIELPFALDGQDPRFAPPVMAWERFRVDQRRNPYFERGDAALFLARRLGRIVGRVAARRPADDDEGRFGFWTLVDDPAVGSALIDAAVGWLSERGCSSMRGPVSFEDDDEPGLLVAGFDVPGCTGRPWHPPHVLNLLEQLGAVTLDEQATWRLPVLAMGAPLVVGGAPGQAAGYVDSWLVSDAVAVVPDLSVALRTSGVRQAWSLARRAREAEWDAAVIVRCHGDPAVLVPAVQAAAARGSYRTVVAPWSPSATDEPETRHRRYRIGW